MRAKEFLKTTTILSICFAGAFSVSASALQQPQIKKKEDTFIEANQLDYDIENRIVSAQGKVEILRGQNVLFADKITYNQRTNIVEAEGNVSIVGPDGNAVFTDRFVLKDDLKDGVVQFFRGRLSDGSLIAAAEARRINESRLELDKAVYSPCRVCPGSSSEPQWQLKAEKVVVDDVAQNITYNDAYLEAYGVPVFYTPYFRHPTPDADRKSGFLIPGFGDDSNLGAYTTIPYYWNISPDMDATFEPIITSDEGLVVAGEFRHATPYGDYQFYASGTKPSKFGELDETEREEKEFRGHLRGEGLFDVSENWKFGFNGEISSDDTYLRKYNYNNADLLTSRGYFERINQRDYSIVQTVYFQGLLEQDNNDTIPLALPYTKNHIESHKGIIPGFASSKLWADFDAFAVHRDVGQKSQRGSLTTGISIPHITQGGHVFELKGSARGDIFRIDNDGSNDNNVERIIPEASVSWSLPLVNDFAEKGRLLFEPIAKILISPEKNYNNNIPNEDSQDIEFSHLNVFSDNRFRGIDRVESGARAQYGFRGGYYADDFKIGYTLGQSFRLDDSASLPVNSGIENDRSDIVGNLDLDLYNTLNFAYRFRIDDDGFKSRRNEVNAALDTDLVELNLNYVFLDFDFVDPTDNREEISGTAKLNVTDEWSILLGGRRNLDENQNIDAFAGLGYESDCLKVITRVSRDYISDRDVNSGTSFGIQVGLKNLGENEF